jgi:hypothetical protein
MPARICACISAISRICAYILVYVRIYTYMCVCTYMCVYISKYPRAYIDPRAKIVFIGLSTGNIMRIQHYAHSEELLGVSRKSSLPNHDARVGKVRGADRHERDRDVEDCRRKGHAQDKRTRHAFGRIDLLRTAHIFAVRRRTVASGNHLQHTLSDQHRCSRRTSAPENVVCHIAQLRGLLIAENPRADDRNDKEEEVCHA